jgi:hypothetical protein
MPIPIAHFILHSKCIRWGLCHTVVLSVNEIKKQNSYHKFLLVWFNHFEKKSVFFFVHKQNLSVVECYPSETDQDIHS